MRNGRNRNSSSEKNNAVKEITEKLEQGLKDLFQSDAYRKYLTTMSKFHDYSFNNTLLIAMQKPDATLVAGFHTWQKEFERHVKKGAKGIRIIAPRTIKKTIEQEVIDPATKKPVMDNDGKPKMEKVEVTMPGFHVVTVFDVSQTEGKELPLIGTDELTGEVSEYPDFMKALEKTSPVPVFKETIKSGAKGYYSLAEKKIVLNENMSEIQNVKTLIHEIAHALLHDKDAVLVEGIEESEHKRRNTKEVEAESVAYTVCQHFGIDTSEYSFGYIAGWSAGRELKELKESMDTIRTTASFVITSICEERKKQQEKVVVQAKSSIKERLAAGEEKKKHACATISPQTKNRETVIA